MIFFFLKCFFQEIVDRGIMSFKKGFSDSPHSITEKTRSNALLSSLSIRSCGDPYFKMYNDQLDWILSVLTS